MRAAPVSGAVWVADGHSRTKQRDSCRQSPRGESALAVRAYGKLAAEGGRAAVAGDVAELQHSIGNQAVQRLLAGTVQRRRGARRRDIRGLPFHLPVGRDALAAETLIKYLAGNASQKVTTEQKKRIVQHYLDGKSVQWLRGVEKSYNHQQQNMYLLLNFKGTPYEFGLWQGSQGRPTSESPLRRDLQAALGSGATGHVAALERALRLRPLTGKEHASALLSPRQRQVAIARAKGQHRELAKWLLNDKTWEYLVINRSNWGPAATKGGFFDIPSDSQRGEWPKSRSSPGRGDELYLGQILDRLKQVEKQVDDLRQQVCAARMAGWIGAGEASKALQWAHSQEVLYYRENLRRLRADTMPGLEKILPIRVVWGTRPKNTREVCRVK